MIKIVKTWCENTEEGENYLKYNGYGTVKRILETDFYICIGCNKYNKLNDVKIVF